MTDQTTADRAERLRRRFFDIWMSKPGLSPGESLADSILADPQSHVDALVEAGVLGVIGSVTNTDDWGRDCGYHVISPKPPHVHDWRWSQIFFQPNDNSHSMFSVAVVRCECGQHRRIEKCGASGAVMGAKYEGPVPS